MTPRLPSRALTLCVVGLWGLLLGLSTPNAHAQRFRNTNNTRFRTVTNGPQSAIVVDVDARADADTTRRTITRQVSAAHAARRSALEREIAWLQKVGQLKPGQKLFLMDTVLVRRGGKLPFPTHAARLTRDVPATNAITFQLASGDETTGGFPEGATRTQLQTIVNRIQEQLNQTYGPPLWSGGTVLIQNYELDAGKQKAVVGAQLVVDTDANGSLARVTIYMPIYGALESILLGLAQAMAQAYHGPYLIGYDAWEQGMSRAFALTAINNLQNLITDGPVRFNILGLYYNAFYDIQNRPELGNSTFLPPTTTNAAYNSNGAGMLVPRLAMSSTAWLKCYIENRQFFRSFNNALYDGATADPNARFDVTRLRQYAASALPNGVEGQPFETWFEQQYVLDTSIRPGRKLYPIVALLPPDGQDPASVSIFLVYFQTTTSGDEQYLSGTARPVYYDNRYSIIQSLESANLQEPITDGLGQILALTGGVDSVFRLAIDLPVDSLYQRVLLPANAETNVTTSKGNPNDFSGVVVGSDTGNLLVQYNNGGPQIATAVANGAFGNVVTTAQNGVPYNQVTLSYTSASGTTRVFKRNTAFSSAVDSSQRENLFSPVFVLRVGEETANGAVTLTHTFSGEPQMIALPLQPQNANLATALFGTQNAQPLLAQYRQDKTGDDHYYRYPSLPPYQPGYGLWSSFGQSVAVNVTGTSTDNQATLSTSLLFGWNQIGSPFTSPLDVNAHVQIQYQNLDPVSVSEAINSGFLAAGIQAYVPTSNSYVDITSAAAVGTATGTSTGVTANQLDAWRGYWLRVIVPEGVTVIYTNPTYVTRSLRSQGVRTRTAPTRGVGATPLREVGGWRLPLVVRAPDGTTAAATLGQSPRGAESFVPSLDVATAPAFTRAATLGVRFPHADWNGGDTRGVVGTDFLSDIRRTGSRSTWNLSVDVPQAQQTYTLTWNGSAGLPRATRLTLLDVDNGTRQLMNNGGGYTFTPSATATTRHFQIVAEARTQSHLFVRNLHVETPLTRALGVGSTISYELNGVAEATVLVRANGRVVRSLVRTRAVGSGLNQHAFDLRDDRGVLCRQERTPSRSRCERLKARLCARSCPTPLFAK